MVNSKIIFFHVICLLTILSNSCTDNRSKISKYQFFWAAIARGNNRLVAKYVNEGIDLEKRSPTGNTALLYAIDEGQSSIAKYLIDNGAKLDVTNKWGDTPFSLAAHNNDTSLLTLIKNKTKEKPIMIGPQAIKEAVAAGDLNALKLLLKQNENFDINHTYPNSMTLLIMATIQGRKNIVLYLIKSGCDISKEDKSGSTALHYANLLEKKDVIPILEQAQKEKELTTEPVSEK